jgi:hypothetical protein
MRVLNKPDENSGSVLAATPLEQQPQLVGSPQAMLAAGPVAHSGDDISSSKSSTVRSRAESSATAASYSAIDSSSKGKNGRNGKEDEAVDKTRKPPANQHLVGRLNTLVTADLSNIIGGKDWLICGRKNDGGARKALIVDLVVDVPVQVALSSCT